jgi:hypothetical protein
MNPPVPEVKVLIHRITKDRRQANIGCMQSCSVRENIRRAANLPSLVSPCLPIQKGKMPVPLVGGGDAGDELKEAMLAADKMAPVYAAEIKQFADLLLAKNEVSKDECAEWAALNFQRKAAESDLCEVNR